MSITSEHVRKHLRSILLLPLLLSPLAEVHGQSPARASRSVIDTERGGYFTYPYADQWSRFGAEFGRTNFEYAQMPANSIKGMHGRLQHFAAVDNPPSGLAYFPWTEFLAYDADEVAQGRPSLIPTATYQGTKRPLYFSYGAYDPTKPFQPVNVRDDRFVKFWIKNYVRAIMSEPYVQNWWMGNDNCTFRYNLYGVLDNSGTYVQNVTWDAPYPQNDTEWVSANLYMLAKVREWAPNIRIVCNDIGLNESQAARQAEFMPYVDGVIREDFWILAGGGSDWYRNAFYESMARGAYRAGLGKVEIIEVPMVATDTAQLRRSWMAFLIFGGESWFFGPKDNTSRELNPALWADMRNRLGKQMSPAQSIVEAGRSAGFRLYSRECEGGIAYLNWTGGNKTISLPAGRNYYNRSGTQITSITLADMVGDYVLFSPTARVSWPAINSRYEGPVTGPVSVKMDIDPVFGTGATIRYTTDGSDPTASSPTYNTPIALSSSATVKARAFKAGQLESFVNAATYSVLSISPAVEFHLSADEGSEFLAKDYPLVKLANVSSATVQVSYSVTGGSATNGTDYTLASGTVTFPPGEQHRYFKIPITNDPVDEANETIQVTLSNPVNATLGTKATYTYTIIDNDVSANQAPVVNITNPTNGASVTIPTNLTASVTDDGLPGPTSTLVTQWSKQAGPGSVTFAAPSALSTSAHFSLPGSYILRLTATDGPLTTIRDVAVNVRDNYTAWTNRYGLSGSNPDVDRDGVSDLAEYALGGHPTTPSNAPRPQSGILGNRLALTFPQDPSLTDLTLTVWGTDDGSAPWTPLASSVGGGPFTILFPGASATSTPNGSLLHIEIRDAYTVGGPNGRGRLLKLRIERP